ncbi:MAG: peptide chain release factor 2 [Puniceicoccales bacterium]|jgi:peptide chain release factor 2|nr:peptide chain release factor 2 [Puniceicoccales bacterium]
MPLPIELREEIGRLRSRLQALRGFLQVQEQREKIAEAEEKMAAPAFWAAPTAAQELIAELQSRRSAIAEFLSLEKKIEELQLLTELLEAEDEASVDTEKHVGELREELLRCSAEMDALELSSFLNQPHDRRPALLTIHAGAGGTESCDWAEMLLRMYQRWGERRGFGLEIQDLQGGEEAGLSRVSLRITGPYAYGYAKAERGVHRLVRISPFDANRRRHTSFCSVDVIAEIEDEAELEIREEELRIDTYRSSGKGGQHVNRTESAIRITHLPTGLVATCQNERSQYKNKASAMKTLRSRLYERLEDEKRSAMEKFYGEKGEMGWGYQIRSYVLQPYQMVKDLRTGVETSDVAGVLDGNLDGFIAAWLRAGRPRARQ